VPCGKHHDRPIAVDEDQAREGRAVGALQLYTMRGSSAFTHPVKEGLGAPGVPNAPPNLGENNLADEVG
jgi:hypothetical protein